VLLASLDVAMEHAQIFKPSNDNQFDLFEEEFMPKPKYMQVDPISQENKLTLEKEALGFYLSDHPISIYEEQLKHGGAHALFAKKNNTQWLSSGVYITSMKSIRTKKGDSMAFLTVSDASGEMDAVTFPNVYKKYSHLLGQGKFTLLEGKIEERDGKQQFIIQNVSNLEEWLKTKSIKQPVLYLKIVEEKQDDKFLQQINKLLKKYQGTAVVILHYEKDHKTIRLSSENNINPAPELLQLLRNMLGPENVVLKD
jgi:DNA polymerase-3 subunit alpha